MIFTIVKNLGGVFTFGTIFRIFNPRHHVPPFIKPGIALDLLTSAVFEDVVLLIPFIVSSKLVAIYPQTSEFYR